MVSLCGGALPAGYALQRSRSPLACRNIPSPSISPRSSEKMVTREIMASMVAHAFGLRIARKQRFMPNLYVWTWTSPLTRC